MKSSLLPGLHLARLGDRHRIDSTISHDDILDDAADFADCLAAK